MHRVAEFRKVPAGDDMIRMTAPRDGIPSML